MGRRGSILGRGLGGGDERRVEGGEEGVGVGIGLAFVIL